MFFCLLVYRRDSCRICFWQNELQWHYSCSHVVWCRTNGEFLIHFIDFVELAPGPCGEILFWMSLGLWSGRSINCPKNKNKQEVLSTRNRLNKLVLLKNWLVLLPSTIHLIKGGYFCVLGYCFSSLSEFPARHEGIWFLLNNKTDCFFYTMVWTDNLHKAVLRNQSYQGMVQTLNHSGNQSEPLFLSWTCFTCNDKT